MAVPLATTAALPLLATIAAVPLRTVSACIGASELLADAECQAWQALYDATGGNEWTGCSEQRLDPCGCNEADPYSPKQVVCDGQSISSLKLCGNNLNGTIPSQLGRLSSLTSLFLFKNNNLHGTIPSHLGRLSSLFELDLDSNQLSGSIPPELGQLPLFWLYLTNNHLDGTLPTTLGHVTGLASLYLSDNQLSGTIPCQLGQLEGLSTLRLDHNQLSGSIPSQLERLARLSELHLFDNKLGGVVPSLPFEQYKDCCLTADPQATPGVVEFIGFACPLPQGAPKCACHSVFGTGAVHGAACRNVTAPPFA